MNNTSNTVNRYSDYIADIVYFLSVCDHMSFTRAAEVMNVSKSVVSMRVKRLENKLQAQLLNRTTRKLNLTDVGELFLERCLTIRNEIKNAEHVVHEQMDIVSGTIRINSPVRFSYVYLIPIIKKFLIKYPLMNVELYPGDNYQCLLSNKLDIGIHVGELDDSSFHAKKILVSPIVTCASKNYLKENGTPQNPDELMSHNCVMYRNSPMGRFWCFGEGEGETKLKVNGNLITTSSDSLISAAINDIGVIMLPYYLVKPHLKRGEMVTILDEYRPQPVNIYLIYPPTRNLELKTRKFIDFLSAAKYL